MTIILFGAEGGNNISGRTRCLYPALYCCIHILCCVLLGYSAHGSLVWAAAGLESDRFLF